MVTGKAQVREFIKYCKKFKSVRIKGAKSLYFKVSKLEIEKTLKIDMKLIVSYSYMSEYTETIWIESIK